MRLQNKNIFITGGEGFIGSHLAESLPQSYLLKARLENSKQIIEETKDMDIIFHLAAEVCYPKKEDIPRRNLEVNTTGTLNILEAMRINDIEHLVFSSTSSVFEYNPRQLPVKETNPKKPYNFYGLSKLFAEELCNMYSKKYGLKITILRYSSVYGKGQNPDWVVAKFIHNAENNLPIIVFGTGNNTGDFVHVNDVVEANILVAEKKAYTDFNIGSGVEISINDLAKIVKEKYNPKVEIRHTKDQEGTRRFVFDISKAKKILGYESKISLQKWL